MRKIRTIVLAAAVLSWAACSFDVTNPGPIADSSLDDPGAWPGLVLGVLFNTARGVSIDAFYGAVVAKEYGTSGRVNATKLPLVFAQLTPDDMSANAWNYSQGGRWQAEDGARRVQRVLGAGAASNKFNGQLLMYAALNNRILGENMCEAVIDGSAKLGPDTTSSKPYFLRADSEATEAIAVATAASPVDATTRDAARLVRASVRLFLGNFAGAASDAALVATAFKLQAPFDANTHNLIVEENDAAIGGQFRAHTVWKTYFENYYRTTGDPRAYWDSSTTTRFGEFPGIIWYRQEKYSSTTGGYGSPINLVSGREARLIEAEVKLRGGDIPGAMTLINGIRTTVVSRGGTAVVAGATLPPYPDPAIGGGLPEAWMDLFHERRVELWLEARSMGDLRRWVADGTYGTNIIPGTYGVGTTNVPTAVSDSTENVANRVRLCIPITRGERQTNTPNLSLTIDDPVSPIFNSTVAPW